MSDTYKDWVNRIFENKPPVNLTTGEEVQVDSAKPFGPISFERIDRPKYVAELGKKGNDFIYHFYLLSNIENFEDKLGDAFISTFKDVDRVEAAYSPELNSWAVRAKGFVDHLWGDELSVLVFNSLDNLLEKNA